MCGITRLYLPAVLLSLDWPFLPCILTNWWYVRKETKRRKRRKCPTQTHCRSREKTRRRWSLSWNSPKRRKRCTSERSNSRSVGWFRRYVEGVVEEQALSSAAYIGYFIDQHASMREGLTPVVWCCLALTLYQVSETEREDLEESEKVQHWVERLCQTRLEQISCVENESPEVQSETSSVWM